VMGSQSWMFSWGSNAVAANQGMELLIAYRLTGNSAYLRAALGNLDYLLGRNATTYCFVTGFGNRSPQHIHHRISSSDGIAAPVPGLLAGGPNPGEEDGVTTYPSSLPALAYTDDQNSYASNEIAINWNAPLVFLSIGMEALTSPDGMPTGVTKDNGPSTSPRGYGLFQNYPNPFNPSTTIEYAVRRDSHAILKVYNLLGQQVRTLFDGWTGKGVHKLQVDTSGLPSGVYFYTLVADGMVSSRKMILAK